jgi:hypothetical protein
MDKLEIEQVVNFNIINNLDYERGGQPSNIILFGAEQYLDSVNYGSETGVVITPDYGVSYDQVLRDDLNSPFTIDSIRLQAFASPLDLGPPPVVVSIENSTLQTSQPISIISDTIYGYRNTSQVETVNAVNPYQQQITIGELKQEFIVYPWTYLNFQLLWGVQLVFSVKIKRQVDVRKIKKLWRHYKAPAMGIKPIIIK